MIIAISGLTGSGKNTLGKSIAAALNIHHLCPTFKDLAAKEGVDLIDFQKKAANDPQIDKKFDELLKQEATKGSCVATTWLSPWMLDANIRIYLFVPLQTRAQRIASRDKMSIEEAKKHIQTRDEQNKARYQKVYDIDISNLDIFDICLNADKFTPKEMTAIVLNILKQKELI